VDDKLCSRKQELCHAEQELNKANEELEEIAERKQHEQFDRPGLQNAAAKKVTEVCTWSHFTVMLLMLILFLSSFSYVLIFVLFFCLGDQF